MSEGWPKRLLRSLTAANRGTTVAALDRRALRVAHGLDAAARVAELASDAAVKQGGGFVLDRRYVSTLGESAAAAAEDLVLDLNLAADGRYLELLGRLHRLHDGVRALLSEADAYHEPRATEPQSPVTPATLAAALAAAPVLTERVGVVLCRGVAAGPLRVVRTSYDLAEVRPGEVVLARSLGPDAARSELDAVAAVVVQEEVAEEVVARVQSRLIPTVAGVGKIGDLPPGGSQVTVDADDGVVYGGRVEMLLAYQDAGARDEEPEYALLRRVRQALFREGTDGADGLRRLVERAAGLLVTHFCQAVTGVQRAAWPPAVVELIPGAAADGDASSEVPCPALEAFLGGCRSNDPGAPTVALTREERAWIIVPRDGGCDLVIASLGPVRYVVELHRSRCGAGGSDEGTCGALRRLGFALAVSEGGVAARMVTSGPAAAMHRLGVLGGLVTSPGGALPPAALGDLVEDVLASGDKDRPGEGGRR